ncbi:hypothetical protein N824_29705 [Pedobacter sp. V48]|nr:hypothetical protein N824_29705 [Pedobacter sp. V48]
MNFYRRKVLKTFVLLSDPVLGQESNINLITKTTVNTCSGPARRSDARNWLLNRRTEFKIINTEFNYDV